MKITFSDNTIIDTNDYLEENNQNGVVSYNFTTALIEKGILDKIKNVKTGSSIFNVDNGDLYMYNKDLDKWNKM